MAKFEFKSKNEVGASFDRNGEEKVIFGEFEYGKFEVPFENVEIVVLFSGNEYRGGMFSATSGEETRGIRNSRLSSSVGGMAPLFPISDPIGIPTLCDKITITSRIITGFQGGEYQFKAEIAVT